MTDPAPLLGAKLLPPAPGPLHLARPRLHARLRQALEGRATAVLAGPGYGKTCLVSRFLQDAGTEAVWLSLDASDRDPWLVFRYLARGLREHAPEFGSRSAGIWRDLRSRGEEVERLCDLFIGDAEESLGGRVLLVLDETHHLEASPHCARAFRRLLAYLPGTLHLVLVGRSIPEIGLRALASEGAATIVRGEELLFQPEETRTLLLETFGLKMRPETVDKVQTRTRGWVTALQLLKQTARLEKESPDLPEEVFVRTESEIFDYFSEEVLAAEDAPVREFLEATSLAAVLDPDLCAEVLPGLDARALLETLVRRRLFVSPLESRAELYAYDPLFRDFLRRRLRSDLGAEGVRDLEMRYGRALLRRGDTPQALGHFVRAESAEEVAALLVRHGKALLRAGMLDLVGDGARFLAARGVRAAALDDLLGEAARLAGDYAAAIGHFESALSVRPPGAGRPAGGAGRLGRGADRLPRARRAEALQGLAYSLLQTGQTSRAASIAEEALLASGDRDPALRARILNSLSIVRYRENRHTEALAGWHEALALARQAQDEHLTLMIAHNLGLPHAVRGDFRRASECFRLLTGPENGRLGPEEGAAFLNLARIETLRGEAARAGRLLGDAREIASRLRLKALTADVLEAEGTLLRDTGDLDGAAAKYARARDLFTELGRHNVLDSLAEEQAILAARRGQAGEAERLAAQVAESRRRAGDEEGLASAHLALGEVRLRAGHAPAAIEPLAESARTFGRLERAYQDCLAHLLLSLAIHQAGRRESAAAAGGEAVRADAAQGEAGGPEQPARHALALAERYDYEAAVLRIAGLDRGFAAWLGSLAGAPAYLARAAAVPASDAPAAAAAALRPAAPAADLTVRLLGAVEVFRDAEVQIPARAWKIRRALEVFCLVASSRDRRATKDRIVDALWGDARPSVIEKNFHPTISYLRQALNHAHHVPKNFILFERGAYLLNPAYRYDVDIERFESGVREARALRSKGDAAAALAAYDQALALYRGPFLEETYDEWSESPRAYYETLYATALEEAGRLHVDSGSAAQGVPLLRRRVERDPIDEQASIDLMRALGMAGDRPAIEKEYARLVRALAEELECEPAPATRQAYERARAPQTGGRPRPRAAETRGT